MDVKGLMAALEESRGSDESGSKRKKEESRLTEAQQADKLLESLSNFTNSPKFKPGDFVRYRAETASIIKNHSRLHMVIEMIDPPIRTAITESNCGDPTTYRLYDVRIAVCDKFNEESVLKYVADSRELEYYPGGERLKKAGTA